MGYTYLGIIGVALLIYYVVTELKYRQTNYYKATKKGYLRVRFNKGYYGEYLTYKALNKYEKDGAKFLYNCYLPKENDETTEIDVLMIHSSGIYVFESKNYSGWIFGSEDHKTWTQTLPNGRKSRKEHFLNPIMQNKLHIKWLENQIGVDYPIHSLIVFSVRCELKKVDVYSDNIKVIKRDILKRTVHTIAERYGQDLTQEEIAWVYERLYPFTQVSEEQKQQHVANIVEKHKNVEPEVAAAPVMSATFSRLLDDETKEQKKPENGKKICPRCGGELVLRRSTKGAYAGRKFYGCSNYPGCRYIENIDEK